MRKILLGLITLALIPAISAVEFDVSVESLAQSSVYGLEYENNTSFQEVNATIFNSGSIGCEFRLRGEFSYGNSTYTRYSEPYRLYSGQSAFSKLHFIPENYTGKIETKLYTEYCGLTDNVKEFNFSSPEKVLPNKTFESEELEVKNSSSKLRIGIKEGRLIPSEAPAYWKTSSARIRNSTARLKYDAPIFSHDEEISYTVVRNGEVLGETTVNLQEIKPSPWENLRDSLPVILLTVSAALNIGFLLRRLEES